VDVVVVLGDGEGGGVEGVVSFDDYGVGAEGVVVGGVLGELVVEGWEYVHVIIWWILVRNSGSRRSMVVWWLWVPVMWLMVRVLSFWVMLMWVISCSVPEDHLSGVRMVVWVVGVVGLSGGSHLCGVVWLRWCWRAGMMFMCIGGGFVRVG